MLSHTKGLLQQAWRSGLCSGSVQDPSPLSAGLNLTEKIKKIKVVFTPTICKQTCTRGRCANSCEKGDTTTLYSQGGHGHDPKSGFRICESPSHRWSWRGGGGGGRAASWGPLGVEPLVL